MKWMKYRFLPVGMLVGILMMNMGKSILLYQTGLFDPKMLYDLKCCTVEAGALFYIVLKHRVCIILLLSILSTTYLGFLVEPVGNFWFGMLFGWYISALVIRYGIKGLFLGTVGLLPQIIFYIPAFALLFVLWGEVYQEIYRKKDRQERRTGGEMLFQIGRIIAIFVLILLGCLSECYLNPGILQSYLKIF